MKYAVESAGGNMWSLVSVDSPHRVLGFVSVTPGPGPLREHTGRCEVTCHDQYAGDASALLETAIGWAGEQGKALLEAFVAETDSTKREWFEASGFVEVARLPGVLSIRDRRVDAIVLHRG